MNDTGVTTSLWYDRHGAYDYAQSHPRSRSAVGGFFMPPAEAVTPMYQLDGTVTMAENGSVGILEVSSIADDDVTSDQVAAALAGFQNALAYSLAAAIQHDQTETAKAPDFVPEDIVPPTQPPAS